MTILEFGPSLVKDVSAEILEPLVHIFNLSLLSGSVPDKLNRANQGYTGIQQR